MDSESKYITPETIAVSSTAMRMNTVPGILFGSRYPMEWYTQQASDLGVGLMWESAWGVAQGEIDRRELTRENAAVIVASTENSRSERNLEEILLGGSIPYNVYYASYQRHRFSREADEQAEKLQDQTLKNKPDEDPKYIPFRVYPGDSESGLMHNKYIQNKILFQPLNEIVMNANEAGLRLTQEDITGILTTQARHHEMRGIVLNPRDIITALAGQGVDPFALMELLLKSELNGKALVQMVVVQQHRERDLPSGIKPKVWETTMGILRDFKGLVVLAPGMGKLEENVAEVKEKLGRGNGIRR